MSRRIVKFCDGCGMNTLDGVKILETRFHDNLLDREGDSTDLCVSCISVGRYICTLCYGIHDHLHPCEKAVK